MTDKCIQETYAPNNKCFGCGPANPDGLRIRSFVEGDEVVCTWHPKKMHEAFDNLVNNAIKYSPKGRNVWIDLTPGLPTPEMVRFSVRDEGPGLTKEDLEKVFGQFQKLSAKPTGGETSSGLGLSIVKSLVEQQKGRVGVRSDGPGTGATFRIDLPLSDNRPNDHE